MKSNSINSIKAKVSQYIKDDLFSRTRHRLTIFYSGLLMLFLCVFMIICYSVYYAVMSSEQKVETTELAREVLASSQIEFQDSINHIGNENIVLTSKEAYFCYVYNKDNIYVSGTDKNLELHSKIQEKLNKFSSKPNSIRNINISYGNDQKIFMQITGGSIYYKGNIIGKFYIGRNLTSYYNTVKRLLLILLSLLVLFLFLASFIGSFMAKRAMIPIIEAYQRQQLFVSDASHELRTPLSVLQASIEVLEIEERNNISEFSNTVLADMKDEVRSMKNLVVDLLTLARSDSGKYELSNEVFDLNAIANQILRATKTLVASKNIKISLEAEKPLIVYGDKEKLKQLLYILLDNAIKYSFSEGSIMISLYSEAIKNVNYVFIKVKDCGIGIQNSQLDRIFDRFFRGDTTRTREDGGTGLGLAIAKSIVEAHHGKIEVESSSGNGTVFKVCIPNRIGTENSTPM